MKKINETMVDNIIQSIDNTGDHQNEETKQGIYGGISQYYQEKTQKNLLIVFLSSSLNWEEEQINNFLSKLDELKQQILCSTSS